MYQLSFVHKFIVRNIVKCKQKHSEKFCDPLRGAAKLDFGEFGMGTVNLQKYVPKMVQGPSKMVFGCPCKWALGYFDPKGSPRGHFHQFRHKYEF